jgi:malic enzyme
MIGEPKNEIVRKATEIRADVLIMGSRKMGTIKRTILGSVSTYCVHNAPCSVVIAKPRQELNPDDASSRQNKRRSIFSRITSFSS